MALPTIIFVHGAWHSGEYFNKVQKILESKGYKSVALEMPSVGRSPPVTSLDEDIETVRSAVLKELDAGHDVVMNAHSWGGIPTCSALDGLSLAERQEQGHTNGVVQLTFACSFMLSEGVSLNDFNAAAGQTEPAPWIKLLDDGNLWAEDVFNIMYHDVDQKEADEYISKLRPHAMATFGDKTRSAAWKKISTAYLVCEDDRAVPVFAQDAMIDNARKEGGNIEVERLSTSHSPYIAKPGVVADFIVRAVGGDIVKV